MNIHNSPAGTAVNGTLCAACAQGFWSLGGQAKACTACTGANSNSCDPKTGKATICSPGNGFVPTSGCTNCTAGSYNAGSSGCATCATGTFALAGAASCTPCSNSTAISSCDIRSGNATAW